MVLVLTLVACEKSPAENNSVPEPPVEYNLFGFQTAYSPPDSTPAAEFELLFIGNSHSSANQLPLLVANLIKVGTQSSAYAYHDFSGKYLDERSFQGRTYQRIKSRSWTHIVLQAQKYSTTGLYHYSTDATKSWIKIVKAENAKPILFPEHPRQGNHEEGNRVYQLHQSIASEEPACVAPISLAWDLVRQRDPSLALHSDGNHANLNGSLLTAYLFYETITGLPANDLPFIPEINVNPQTQTFLKEISTEVALLYPPCFFLP